MIVNRRPGVLELIDQVEHGRVAGVLAEAWGNERFAAPAPTPAPAVALAAARHDEGWRAVDGALLFDELEKRPMHFLDIDVEVEVRSLPDRGWTQAEAIAHLGRHRNRTRRWRVGPPAP